MLANQVFRKLKVLTNVNIFIMKTFITLLLLLSFGSVRAADLFIEAESFSNKGGWKVDQQFMDLMGSPYLLAHGMGVPVDDAVECALVHGDLAGQAAGLELLGQQMFAGNVVFFHAGIAGQLNDVHAVPQRAGDAAQVVGGGNKEHMAQIKRDIDEMIVEGAVLLRVQRFQQRRLLWRTIFQFPVMCQNAVLQLNCNTCREAFDLLHALRHHFCTNNNVAQ